ncbi:MAG: PHP domain-containing protein [Halobacteriaceae archaeon]
MVYADLHVHTTTSDGVLTLETLPAAADDAGVSVVAVTDHDRINDDLGAPVVERDGLTIINGIELRVDPGDAQDRVDLLGYGLEPTPALRDEIDRLQADRRERGAAIQRHLEARLDVTLDVDIRSGIGRPHLAKAVVDHPDTQYTDPDDVFASLIGEDGPCFVPRDVTSFQTGTSLLADACAIVALAHPFRYDDPATALELATDLDAVEGPYPYDHRVEDPLLDAAIADHDLLVTGGSDAHDTVLGRAGLSEREYRELRPHLSKP